jgi:hypothetical protein
MGLKAGRTFGIQKNIKLKNEETPLEIHMAPADEATDEETPEITCLEDYWNPEARFPIPYVRMNEHIAWIKRWNRLHRVVTKKWLTI